MMEIYLSLLLFVLGFYILVKGANILIRGATSIAHIFDVSNWFIGLVIVSIGTSIPEFSINIASVFNGTNVGLPTIIGSNTFNILVILGLSAIVTPLVMKRIWVRRDFLVSIGAVTLASLFILFPIVGDSDYLGVTRGEGMILTLFLLLWLVFVFKDRRAIEKSADPKIFTVFASMVMIIFGIIGVFIGGRWVVDGAEAIALLVGVSPTLVALTLVAIGTSVPEFVVSAIAAVKRNAGIAVGNILGSSIFNFLGIVGVTSLLRPIPVFANFQFDILIVVAVVLLLFISMFIGKRYVLTRKKGVLFLILYLIYLAAIFFRG